MIKSFYSFSCLLCLILLSACTSLHRGIPRGERHHRVERERPAAIVQTVVDAEEIREKAPAETVAEPEEQSATAELTETETSSDKQAPITVNENRLARSHSGDTAIAAEDEERMYYEAIESERIARNAYIFSWLPIGWVLFFPLLLVGIIGTIVCLVRFRSYEFVTEKGLAYKEKAVRTVVLSSLLSILAAIVILGLILILILLTF